MHGNANGSPPAAGAPASADLGLETAAPSGVKKPIRTGDDYIDSLRERDIVWYIPASRMDAIKQVRRNCCACIPMPDPGPAENIGEVVRQVQPLVIATDMGELSEAYMKTAHEHHVRVFVDEDKGDETEWTRILEWGVDGIQTGEPRALIRFLSQKKKAA